ncbi:hypothetical protein ElyMa_005735800 [Elysia marginata]|uniref:Uncharacterized protein n=1 Tax=Elysia marginata TaxID=1093978 RepID=A0AAV4FLQ9_9GAST|nr:hypothetical protein ElyMa_005735800 [Elysia marginata]
MIVIGYKPDRKTTVIPDINASDPLQRDSITLARFLISSLQELNQTLRPICPVRSVPSLHCVACTSKDIDAVESQRLERIQAARRIKRVKSTQSRRSYSADSRNEDGSGGSSCLPICLRGQRRSDKDRLYRSRQESSCSDFPSPDSNPPSYDGACRGRARCNSGIEENAALLVDVTSSSHRS